MSDRVHNAARSRRCRIRYVAGAAGESKTLVASGDAFSVLQISVFRTSLWNAFAADEFERIGLAGHRDTSIAKTCPCNGQFASKAILGIGFDARAAGGHAAVDRQKLEAGWTGALPAGQGASIADDAIVGSAGSVDIGDATSARCVQMRIGRTHALPRGVVSAAGALTGNNRRRLCMRRERNEKKPANRNRNNG